MTERAQSEQEAKERLESLLETYSSERDEAQACLETVSGDLAAAQVAIALLRAATTDLQSKCDQLSTKLDAITSDKGSVETMVVNLEASKAEVAELGTLQTKIGPRVVLKSEELHDAQVSLEEALEQIETLKASLTELESHLEEFNAMLEQVHYCRYGLF